MRNAPGRTPWTAALGTLLLFAFALALVFQYALPEPAREVAMWTYASLCCAPWVLLPPYFIGKHLRDHKRQRQDLREVQSDTSTEKWQAFMDEKSGNHEFPQT